MAEKVLSDSWGYRVILSEGTLRFERSGSFLVGVFAAVAGLVTFCLAVNGFILALGAMPDTPIFVGLMILGASLFTGALTVFLYRKASGANKQPKHLATLSPQTGELLVGEVTTPVYYSEIHLVLARNWLYQGIGNSHYVVAKAGGLSVRLCGVESQEDGARLIHKLGEHLNRS